MFKYVIPLLLVTAVASTATAEASTAHKRVWRWSAAYTNRIFKATHGEDKFGHKPPATYDEAPYTTLHIDRLEAVNAVKCHGNKGRKVVKRIPVFSGLACLVDAQVHLSEPDEQSGVLEGRVFYSVCVTPLSRVQYAATWYTDAQQAPCF